MFKTPDAAVHDKVLMPQVSDQLHLRVHHKIFVFQRVHERPIWAGMLTPNDLVYAFAQLVIRRVENVCSCFSKAEDPNCLGKHPRGLLPV